MKILISIVFAFNIILIFVPKQNEPFLNKVLSNYSRNSYYIAIDAANPTDTFQVIINNDGLFYFLKKTNGINRENYAKYVKSLIDSHKKINLPIADLKKYGFIKVKPSRKIEIEKKNEIMILKKYFKNKTLIDGVSEADRSYLIYLLFKWSIATKIDDESGALIYEK
jgi:hypothetical protein